MHGYILLNFHLKRRVDVYVTEGLLDKFDKDEIRAILYHEMGHAKLKHAHYTMFLTLIVTLFMGISMYYARQVMLATNGWWQYVLIFPSRSNSHDFHYGMVAKENQPVI
ncbi:hypothetical protein BsIDN1_32930 [Bacillus safensis]|uniref:Peptidase M48 domain-containing protein n=1 Tax=Bacillus safensis TaxID=561879 RepID=A0A5S9M9Y4_BACIA|nr:hypothetical protein BsIDN1_32930 [Bacillus safensis]